MHTYRHLAKQVYQDPNQPDPAHMHWAYRRERRAREQAIQSLKRLLSLVEHFGEMKRITEEAA